MYWDGRGANEIKEQEADSSERYIIFHCLLNFILFCFILIYFDFISQHFLSTDICKGQGYVFVGKMKETSRIEHIEKSVQIHWQ